MHRTMYVKCGHCPSCLQEKALKRTQRIRWQDPDTTLKPWMITLTYDNRFIPYITQDNFTAFCKGETDKLLVRRDFVRTRYHVSEQIKPNLEPLAVLTKADFDYYGYSFDFSKYINVNLPPVRKYIGGDRFVYISNKIGVSWLPDIQNFFNRFKTYFKRDIGFALSVDNFKYYYCTEYGPEGHRPHIHALLWLPSEFTKMDFMDTICKAWSFSDRDQIEPFVDRCKNAASYVASYVNCRESAETFFRYAKPFMPTSQASQDFGYGLDEFNAYSLLEAYLKRDMRFAVQRVKKGILATEYIIYPKYALNRYFPKFLGYGRLTPGEVQDIILQPAKLLCRDYAFKLGYTIKSKDIQSGKYKLPEGLVCYDDKPLVDRKRIYQTINSINRRYDRFYYETGMSRLIFAEIYANIWSIRLSNLMVDSYEHNADYSQFVYRWDNVKDHYIGLVYHDLVDYALSLMNMDFDVLPRSDPNEFPDTIARSNNFAKYYDWYCKDKKVRDYIYSRKIRRYA